MFSKLFGCCAKGTYNAELYEVVDGLKHGTASSATTTDTESTKSTPEKKRFGFLHRLRHRRTKEEEILLYEKRYLRKFLRHYAMYINGMSVEQMRIARRLVGISMLGETAATSSSQSQSSQGDKDGANFCAYCCHCFGCAREKATNAKVGPKPGIVEPENEGLKTEEVNNGEREPGGIVAEAKRVVDRIRKENARKQQMGTPPEEVQGDQGHDEKVAEVGTEKTERVPAGDDPKPLGSNEEVESIKNDTVEETTKSVKIAETKEAEIVSETESEDDQDEMLSIIRRGQYVSFDQPECDVEADCRGNM
ncbi:AAEL004652-PA [Aedes aegypti]|uniref:AAEL004652-PA n=1 Tax=Aedes aegypti TaxID=7159 RepID=Q17C97_AEDAE|nr:AAEL004652-PA [Aedes aegypti]